MRFLASTIVILALSACTTVPEQIQGTYPDISPARVEPGVYGSNVRWGGVILDSRNTGRGTCFEILSKNLDKHLRPELHDATLGRFIACKHGFHDPVVFTKGREITMTGRIQNIEVRKIDEFDYRYPMLEVDDLVLWQKRRIVMQYRGFNGPFHGPCGGRGLYWGGYPYYHRPFPMYGTGYAEPRPLLPDPAIIESHE
jgi:outer membrane lipoprotein